MSVQADNERTARLVPLVCANLRTNAAPELERARTAERSLNVRGSETSLNRLVETSCRVSRGPACGTRA